MARKSASTARSSSKPAAAPKHGASSAPAIVKPAAAVPMTSAPAPASTGGGLLSGIGGSIMSGMAMGVGSSIAHRAVDSVLGPRETVVTHKQEVDRCQSHEEALSQCKGSYFADCAAQAEALRQCRA